MGPGLRADGETSRVSVHHSTWKGVIDDVREVEGTIIMTRMNSLTTIDRLSRLAQIRRGGKCGKRKEQRGPWPCRTEPGLFRQQDLHRVDRHSLSRVGRVSLLLGVMGHIPVPSTRAWAHLALLGCRLRQRQKCSCRVSRGGAPSRQMAEAGGGAVVDNVSGNMIAPPLLTCLTLPSSLCMPSSSLSLSNSCDGDAAA